MDTRKLDTRKLNTRKLGPFEVSAISFGAMSLSHAYGAPTDAETAAKVLNAALDQGYTMIDTAALYGFGANETLIGHVLAGRRKEYILASKCGMFRDAEGKRSIDGRPEIIKSTCDDSLRRLKTDVIDLYYLHRWDKKVPIEDSIGALSDLVKAGKIKTIGLSEVSADTLKKAHRVHPITAVQTEYSLWTRNAEIKVLDACAELGTAFVAFSPVARGYLTGKLRDLSTLPPKDIRLSMPRFQGENWQGNLQLLDAYGAVAREVGCTMAQLALAWLLAKRDFIVPIPGTTRLDHLEENAGGAKVHLSAQTVAKLDAIINPNTVRGERYNHAAMVEIDTENA